MIAGSGSFASYTFDFSCHLTWPSPDALFAMPSILAETGSRGKKFQEFPLCTLTLSD